MQTAIRPLTRSSTMFRFKVTARNVKLTGIKYNTERFKRGSSCTSPGTVYRVTFQVNRAQRKSIPDHITYGIFQTQQYLHETMARCSNMSCLVSKLTVHNVNLIGKLSVLPARASTTSSSFRRRWRSFSRTKREGGSRGRAALGYNAAQGPLATSTAFKAPSAGE